MEYMQKFLKGDEKAIYKLRELYCANGYTRYKVNQFEEYDLYAKNKSFLISEDLLTFTDTNGKLMALKPDVTLSIVKNVVSDPGNSYKLFYDEQVYRTTNGADGFKEIRQTGLETIGNLDLFSECEVLMLAMKSLENINDEYLLDISHMGLLEGLLENLGVEPGEMPEMFSLIAAKNLHAIREFCRARAIDGAKAGQLCELTAMYLPVEEALAKLSLATEGEKMQSAYEELTHIVKTMNTYGLCQKLYLDLSLINDMRYYDGIIFKGFVNAVPQSILTGGRYDRLMERLGKKTGALGFAVYLDRLERIGAESDAFDVDYLLVYEEGTEPCKIIAAAQKLKDNGESVRTQNSVDCDLRYRHLVKLGKDGTLTIETDD